MPAHLPWMAMAFLEQCALIQVQHLTGASITCIGPPLRSKFALSRWVLRSHRPRGGRRSAQPAPVRNTAFSGCLRPYCGQVGFKATPPCSQLDGCHPRHVDAYVDWTQSPIFTI